MDGLFCRNFSLNLRRARVGLNENHPLAFQFFFLFLFIYVIFVWHFQFVCYFYRWPSVQTVFCELISVFFFCLLLYISIWYMCYSMFHLLETLHFSFPMSIFLLLSIYWICFHAALLSLNGYYYYYYQYSPSVSVCLCLFVLIFMKLTHFICFALLLIFFFVLFINSVNGK